MTAPYYADDLVTLYHGDCRGFLPDVIGGALVMDPPYGITYRSGSRRKAGSARGCANDHSTEMRDAVLQSRKGRRALVFGSWKVARPIETRVVLYWDTKGALGMGDLSLPWRNSTQEIYVLGSGFVGRRKGNVLRFAPVQSIGRRHPFEKPVDLMIELVKHCPDNVIVDPFAGSGSTLEAAKLLGKRAIGMELDEAHCEQAARRLSQGVLLTDGAA